MRFLRCILSVAVTLPALSLSAETSSSSARFELNQEADAGSGGPIANAGSTVVANTSTGGSFSGGVSSVTTSGFVSKPNYIGQLYDVGSVAVTASPTTVNESETRQLAAIATMDDGTTLANLAETIWTVDEAAILEVDASTFIATAGIVYEDTLSTVEASIFGTTGSLALTVLNTALDNYPGYGGDGLDDGWQVQYFGAVPVPEAAPDQNPDGDRFNNADEFLTGFSPVDSNDFLRLTPAGFASGVATLRINKVIPGRLYTIKADTELSGSFSETVGSSYSYLVEETDTLLFDNNANETRKFYILEVSEAPAFD